MILGAALFGLTASAAADKQGVEWPEPLHLSLAATSGASNWGDVDFEEPVALIQMPGNRLQLGRLRTAGAEVRMGYVGEVFRVGVGMGYATTRSDPGTEIAALGDDSHIQRVHLFRWFVEAGLRHRFGDLTPFLMVQAAWARALVDVAGPEALMFRGHQPMLGPRVGLRAHIFKQLFVEASFFADVLRFPDHVLSVGLGVGP